MNVEHILKIIWKVLMENWWKKLIPAHKMFSKEKAHYSTLSEQKVIVKQ